MKKPVNVDRLSFQVHAKMGPKASHPHNDKDHIAYTTNFYEDKSLLDFYHILEYCIQLTCDPVSNKTMFIIFN